MKGLRERIGDLGRELRALHLASRDPRVPRRAKMVIAVVLAYALSPIDLIPDFIPVLGQVDDLILVPLGIALALRMIPEPLMEEHRAAAAEAPPTRGSWIGAVIMGSVWLILLFAMGRAFTTRL